MFYLFRWLYSTQNNYPESRFGTQTIYNHPFTNPGPSEFWFLYHSPFVPVSLTAKPPRCIAPAKPSLSNLRWRSDSAAGLGIGFVGKILPETVVDHQVPGAFLIFFPFSQSNDLQYLGIRWYKSKRSAPPPKKNNIDGLSWKKTRSWVMATFTALWNFSVLIRLKRRKCALSQRFMALAFLPQANHL